MRACLMMCGIIALAACAPQPEEQSAAEPMLCGGLQGLACGIGEYCSYPQTGFCGAADQTGMCLPRPQACTMEYDPVCGCDGVTYPNACAAAAQGASVATPGECRP